MQSLADRYARRLKSRDSFSKSVTLRVSEEEPMASLGEQAGILRVCCVPLMNIFMITSANHEYIHEV